MKITFIIASLDREKDLQNCINSIERAYEKRKNIKTEIEVLIVFQNNQKNNFIRTKYPEFTNFYYIEEKGLARARNFAIKKSSGDYLVFLDDDATIKDNFIEILSNNSFLNKGIAFCGRIINPEDGVPFTRFFYNNSEKYLNRFDFRYFMGSAHVLSKKVFEKAGYYDENFGIGSKYRGAEESDLFFRLKKINENIIYIPELIFYHPFSYEVLLSKSFNYSYALGSMLTKQIFSDKMNFAVYILIFLNTLVIRLFRILQKTIFFSNANIREVNCRYHLSVLKGTLAGITDFIINHWRNKK